MPAYNATSRFALRYSAAGNKVADFATIQAALAGDIDANMLGYLTGLLAGRGAAGTAGRIHLSTDQGRIAALDDGVSWRELIMGSPARANCQTSNGHGGAGTLGAGVTDITDLTVITFDPENRWNTSGQYVAPRAGPYLCTGQIAYTASTADLVGAQLSYSATGIGARTTRSRGAAIPATAGGQIIQATVSDVLQLAIGDHIGLQASIAAGGGPLYVAPTVWTNYLSIVPLC